MVGDTVVLVGVAVGGTGVLVAVAVGVAVGKMTFKAQVTPLTVKLLGLGLAPLYETLKPSTTEPPAAPTTVL